MSKSLNFELGLSIIKAKKEVDKFVQDTNKKMGKLKTKITISRKNADKDDAKKEKEDYRIRLAQLKTEQEARESAAQAEIERWEEGKKAAKEAHDARVKAAKNTAEEERKANEAIQKAVDKNHEKVRKDLEKENKAREDAATKRQASAKKEFDAHQAELQKQQAAVKKQQDQIEDLRVASNHRINRMEISAGASNLQAWKKYTTDLEHILATSNQRSLEATRQMIRSIEAEYNKVNRMALTQQNRQAVNLGGGLATRNIGRQVNMMFNLQQAVEDFSYAGMRGASNNLATMAAAMGGPAGIAAMAALAAYNIYQLGDSLGWFGEKTGKVNEQLLKHVELLRTLKDERADREREFSSRSFGTSKGDIRTLTRDLNRSTSELDNASEYIDRLRYIEDNLLEQLRVNPGEILAENRDILGASVSDFNEFYKFGSSETVTKLLDSIKEERMDRVKDLSTRQLEVRDNKEMLGYLRRIAPLEEAITKNREKLQKTGFSGINTKDLPKLERFVDTFKKTEEQRLESLESTIERRQRTIETMFDRRMYDKIPRAMELLNRYVKEQTKEFENSSTNAETLAKRMSDVYETVSKISPEMKSLADSAKRAAEASWEQVKAVKAAKLANQRSFESTVFGARNSILDKQAQEEIQKRQSQLGTVEGRQKYDEFWVKYMFGDNKHTQRLIQERAKLIGQFHSQAMQDIQTQVERERSKRADKLLNDRIGVLQDRSKSQTKAGDFQGSLSTLQEMQGLYLSAMGSAGSSAQMQAFLKRAEDVQKQMDAVHDKNIERETEAAEKATERARQAQELLDQSLKTKEAIESLDPNANGALDKLLQMQNMLEQMRLDAEGIKMSLEGNGVAFNGFGPIPGGNQVAGVGGGNNITNINVASINTNAANAGSLVTDLNAQAKRKGIMVG